jgi:hypothetical protein
VLAVEPEPDTTLETASEVIRFFEDVLLPAARAAWRGRFRTGSALEAVLRRYFTVNLDTCHLSAVFQSPARSLLELAGAGIATGKIHATSTLALGRPFRSPRGYAELRRMHEPRFLHQVAGAGAGGRLIWRGRDLGELPRRLRRGCFPAVEELRTHFHVPLHLRRWGRLRTTQDDTREALRTAVSRRLCAHIVIETYTWPVLAREEDLIGGLAREFRWLLGVLSWPGTPGRGRGRARSARA